MFWCILSHEKARHERTTAVRGTCETAPVLQEHGQYVLASLLGRNEASEPLPARLVQASPGVGQGTVTGPALVPKDSDAVNAPWEEDAR